MKELTKFKTWSTFVYVIPLILAIHYRIIITIVPLGLLIAVCLIYHYSNEQKFRWLDHVLAWVVIASNVVICYLGGFAMPFFGLTIVAVAISMAIYIHPTKKSEYNSIHGIWHIASSLITIFSILTYVQGTGV